MSLNIDSVAIIGAGPAGIAALYELLHTTKDGESTVGSSIAANCKFSKLVAFEQKDAAGGIWAPSLEQADWPVPPQDLLNTEKYNLPDIIHPSQAEPEELDGATVHQPIQVQHDSYARELEWRRSGIFRDLYTNIPTRFTRFSYMENDPKYMDKKRTIFPFLSREELCTRIEKFIATENLNDYIRFDSKVQKINKNKHGKWEVTIKKSDEGKGVDEWYKEEFDGIIIANGHYTVPNIPHIPGLADFNSKNPGFLIHANSYRDPEEFRNKKVLVIGGSISTINILQYIAPIANVTVASRGNHKLFPWIDKAIRSDGITHRPQVKAIDPATGVVTFVDGNTDLGFEKIVFTTGYHFHYPFLKDHLAVVNPSNSSRVSGLFFNTFSIEDPSLAAVGVTCSTLNFHTIEASSAAIAGVWSGAAKLPPKADQRKLEDEQIKTRGSSTLFHYYTHNQVLGEFVQPISKYFPKGRKCPLEEDGKYLDDVQTGIESIEQIFYKVKNGELKVEDTQYKVDK